MLTVNPLPIMLNTMASTPGDGDAILYNMSTNIIMRSLMCFAYPVYYWSLYQFMVCILYSWCNP